MDRSKIFASDPEKPYAISIFGPDDIVDYDEGSVQHDYLRLRADVYIDQTGFLDPSMRRQDGTESDHNDSRSAHIVALENKLGRAAVIGCMRLPYKTLEDMSPLPIEEFFPEKFSVPLEQGTVEVSRLIANSDNFKIRNLIKRKLILHGLAYIVQNDLGPIYAVVEEPLRKDLEEMGVPIDTVAGPKYVDKYHSTNIGIEVDKDEFERRLGRKLLMSLFVEPRDVTLFGETK